MDTIEQIVKIDRAGRIVIPKEIRDALHLSEGTALKLNSSPEVLTLVPQESSPQLRRKNGFLVCSGELLTEEDAVKKAREERTQEFRARIGL
jgi:AbrB family looped-hinge helix DNA binding protein